MSCNYADGLSPYENKGIVGVPEKFDDESEVNRKCEELVKILELAKHVVVHTGAGISTSAGIPDFRGPNGVWTLEKNGKKPTIDISFEDAVPTKTHMALKALVEKGYVRYIISQNIDGLHLKSGIPRKYLSELHGNMFIEHCNKCKRQFVRKTVNPTVGQKPCGGMCRGSKRSRPCRGGILLDNILDWEDGLPERDLELSTIHSTLADVNITLGTTLQILPSGNLPLKSKKNNGKLIICNLQPTKHDKKADIILNTYVDDILTKVCKRLGIEICEYCPTDDPTKSKDTELEWTIPLEDIKEMNKLFACLKENSKKKIPVKAKKQKMEEKEEIEDNF